MTYSWFKPFIAVWPKLWWTSQVVCGAILVLAALLIFASRFTFFGHYHLYSVQSGSMEPTIPAGSLLMTHHIETDKLAIGDIVLFSKPGVTATNETLVTHRIKGMIERQGNVYFTTQGDASKAVDPWLVPAASVQGKYARHVVKLGIVTSFVRSPAGTILFVVAPSIVIVIYELQNLVHHLVWLKLEQLREGV